MLSFVDAVQLAPHVPIDVQELGCDFLVCSAYKFFGPHQGILWGRRDVLESLEPYKLRPAPDELPGSFETGTQSHEGMAGTIAAVDYFAGIGESMAQAYHDAFGQYDGRSRYVHAALAYLFDYEEQLTKHLIGGLQQLPGVHIQGITAPDAMQRRVPTVAITVDGALIRPPLPGNSANAIFSCGAATTTQWKLHGTSESTIRAVLFASARSTTTVLLSSISC